MGQSCKDSSQHITQHQHWLFYLHCGAAKTTSGLTVLTADCDGAEFCFICAILKSLFSHTGVESSKLKIQSGAITEYLEQEIKNRCFFCSLSPSLSQW